MTKSHSCTFYCVHSHFESLVLGISQYEGSSIGGSISPAVVAGIVVGVVVFVGVLLTAVIIISVYTRVSYKRKQQQRFDIMIF